MRSRQCVEQIPIGVESDFEGVFDLVSMKAITWNGEVRIASNCLLACCFDEWLALAVCASNSPWLSIYGRYHSLQSLNHH